MGRKNGKKNLLFYAIFKFCTTKCLFSQLQDCDNFHVLTIRKAAPCNAMRMQYLKQRTLNFSKVKGCNFTDRLSIYSQSCRIPNWNLTEDGACARTGLTFMVQSICRNYK